MGPRSRGPQRTCTVRGWQASPGQTAISSSLSAWLLGRRRRRHPIDDALWAQVVAELPLCDGLPARKLHQLRELTTRFIADKRCFGAQGFEVDDYVRVAIGAQACRLALNLGYGTLAACRTLVIYPAGFVAPREVWDEDGIVHRGYEELDGEAMYGGAVALAWDEARPWREAAGQDAWTGNVVLHEFAHKFDELSGHHNGHPPLRKGMSAVRWAATLSAAFEGLREALDRGESPPLDDYAAQSPAEFFAVLVEAFFTAPWIVAEPWPTVHAQLVELFGEDPLAHWRTTP